MKRLSLVAILVAASGCSATMVKPAGSAPVANAPVNEASLPGLVRYSTDGASFVIKKRRASAYKKMSESCGGAYKITAEGQQVEGGVVVSTTDAAATASARRTGSTVSGSATGSSSTTSVQASTHAWYIQYECAREDSGGSLVSSRTR